MIQRYSEVSDGKRYHALNRDPDGEWCKYADAADLQDRLDAYRAFVANKCIAAGITTLPLDTPFNVMVENLIAKLSQPKTTRSITDRLRDASETLLCDGMVTSAYLCQEAADEIDSLRERRTEYEEREAEHERGIRSRKDGWE